MNYLSIPLVDLMQYFGWTISSDEELEALFWDKDQHFNANGYRRFAEGVEVFLREN